MTFTLSRSGDFASLAADISLSHATTKRMFASWLLHVPSRRVLSVDDLFIDAKAAERLVSEKVRPSVEARLKSIYVRGRTEAERHAMAAMIDQRVVEATDPARSSAWQVELDHADPCEPGLLMTFDASDLSQDVQERITGRFSVAGIGALLKPEYRHGLGERTEPIATRPPFASDVVSRQFPSLLEESSKALLPLDELQPDLVDCSTETLLSLDANPNAERSQWMYNGFYRWVFAAKDNGTCIVMLYPEQRGLARDEAWALLSAVKRQLPFDEAQLDPQFAYAYPIDVAQSFGGSPTYAHGLTNGVDYAIGSMGFGVPLRPFVAVQQRFVEEQIAAATKLALRHRDVNSTDAASVKLSMDFVAGGRTAELAVLAVQGSVHSGNDESTPISASWILHVPSGKLITFDDLFIDPGVVRKKVSDNYRRHILPSNMDFHAFVGADAEEQAAAFRSTYRRIAYAVSTPIPEHFRDVRLETLSSSGGISVYFSSERLPPGDGAFAGATYKYLRPHLRAKYSHALDPLRVLSGRSEGLEGAP